MEDCGLCIKLYIVLSDCFGMALNVIVCDDSGFARKQLIRSIPKSLVKELYQASNGLEAMKLLREGKGEILFLDLTMPVMDGYQVLDAIAKENLNVLVIVISGDVQEQAKKIINQYNVLAFVNKPLKSSVLLDILVQHGLCKETDTELYSLAKTSTNVANQAQSENRFDELRERINIATGVAAAKMADMMNLFITMPVPEIKICNGLEVYETLYTSLEVNDDIAISQGFVGSNILGESILLIGKKDAINYYHFIAEDKNETRQNLNSAIIELCGLISGSLLRSFASQFSAVINMTHPALIQLDKNILCKEKMKDSNILSVRLEYKIKSIEMNIDCYLLFTGATSSTLNSIMAFA